MKHKKNIAILLSVVLMLSIASAGQTGQKGSSKPTSTAPKTMITGFGFVTAGVEAGCLMLQDSRTKTLYNLVFATRNKPALGTTIRFTGKKHDGPTACMQGEAVDVKTWTRINLKAPAAGPK